MSKPYSRTPGGLFVPLAATMRGRVRWQVLDERGVPEVPRTESGFAIGPAEGIEQSNLITDLGMDAATDYSVLSTALSSPFATWRGRMKVGTSSVAPAVSDIILGNEVQRASSSGAFPVGTIDYALDDILNVWRATSLVTRLVEMNADRNLTEFGFSALDNADVYIRELLRDGVGDPITVSLLTGKSLRVDHTLTVEIPAPVGGNAVSINIEEYDAGNNLVATIAQSIIHGGHVSDNVEGAYGWPFVAWDPSAAIVALRALITNKAYGRINVWTTDADQTPPTGVISGGTSGISTEKTSYTPGSFTMTKRGTMPTGTANVPWYGFSFTQAAFNQSHRQSGWFVVFDSPATYTKLDTDTVRCGLVSTWARA